MKLAECCARAFVAEGVRFCPTCGTTKGRRVYQFPRFGSPRHGRVRYFVQVGRFATVEPGGWFLSGAIPEVYQNGPHQLTDGYYIRLREVEVGTSAEEAGVTRFVPDDEVVLRNFRPGVEREAARVALRVIREMEEGGGR